MARWCLRYRAGRLLTGAAAAVLGLERRLDELFNDLAGFTLTGRPSEVLVRDGLRYVINEFWTSRQRQGHSIHEVSYRACFKPELPRFLIERLTEPEEVVHDPFMGRGTTLIVAALLGRVPSGTDINPLSVLLTRPRLDPPGLSSLLDAIEDLDLAGGQVTEHDLTAFFHPDTLAEIEVLRADLIERAPVGTHPDPVDDWIRMVTINRLTGHSAGFLSGRSLPPNQAATLVGQRRINRQLEQTPPRRDVRAVLAKKTRTLLRDPSPPTAPSATLLTGPAEATPSISAGSVALVVTSPPFLAMLDYAADNWLRCWFAGINPADVKMSHHRTTEDWTAMVHRVLAEQARILAPGRLVAFEVGEVRSGTVRLELLVRDAAAGLPLEVVGVMVNEQTFTKTSNIWGITNATKGTNTNRIVLLRRR